MPADMREVLHDAAAPDENGPDIDAILARAGRLRARRRVIAGVAVLVPLAVLAAVLLPSRVDVGLVDRPAPSVLEVPTAEEQSRQRSWMMAPRCSCPTSEHTAWRC